MIIECIKEGFSLTNKNLQLVLLRIIVTIINLVSFFIFLAVPLIAAVAYLGFDLAQAKDLLPILAKNPFEFVSKYLGLVFLIGASFIFYLIFISILFLYVLGGILGVLRNSAVYIQFRFSLSSFFKEANKNFFRLFWLISLLLFVFIILFVTFILLSVIIAAIQQAFTGTESTLEIFFRSFVLLTIVIFGIIAFLICLIFAVYSVVASVIEGGGVIDSVKKSFNLLKQKPQPFLLYIILVVGVVAANFIFYGVQISFNMVPGMGPLFTLAFYLINAFFHSYLAIVVWSSLVVYYVKSTNYPVYSSTYEI